MSILFGCDYIERISIIGPSKAYEIILEVKKFSEEKEQIKNLPLLLNKYLKHKTPLDTYMKEFEKALDIFRHHIVYSILDERQCCLNDGESTYWN